IYNDTVDHAYSALAYSENMLEILRLWLETLGDNERDKRNSNIATALITLLEPVIAYSALFDHGLASKFDQRFASIRSTGNLTFSTAF
ncbi:hypothetical protein, partial [Escherichia coli]|uniref:hypothetical protein n=1 Tax=Escherichia coli TaxID=562 RepID=UPI00207B5401